MKHYLTTAAAVAIAASAASAQDVTLRIQTHYASEHPTGIMLAQFIDDVQTMSGGEIAIEMFYASAVVATTETFDAAIDGILDCDATGGAYQTGKNPAFQFVGDIMGGYDTPWQQYSWLYYGDGYAAAQELYNDQNMQLIGWCGLWSGIAVVLAPDCRVRRSERLEIPLAPGPGNRNLRRAGRQRPS